MRAAFIFPVYMCPIFLCECGCVCVYLVLDILPDNVKKALNNVEALEELEDKSGGATV